MSRELTDAELLAASGDPHDRTLLAGIRTIIGDGGADDVVSVEGSEPENATRVANWILWTDSQGNEDLQRFVTVAFAEEAIARYEHEFVGGSSF
jgi:hypothetical protein